jgi:hypothetical protein
VDVLFSSQQMTLTKTCRVVIPVNGRYLIAFLVCLVIMRVLAFLISNKHKMCVFFFLFLVLSLLTYHENVKVVTSLNSGRANLSQWFDFRFDCTYAYANWLVSRINAKMPRPIPHQLAYHSQVYFNNRVNMNLTCCVKEMIWLAPFLSQQ